MGGEDEQEGIKTEEHGEIFRVVDVLTVLIIPGVSCISGSCDIWT
jgi:hypothetical protein